MVEGIQARDFVPESRFGFWFLGTQTWALHVLKIAIADLQTLIGPMGVPSRPVILDAGCGQGKSFGLLQEAFDPRLIVAIDVEDRNIERSTREIAAVKVPVHLKRCSCAAIDFEDASVDIVFCHQTFHHLVDQERALSEFFRVLKPGGLLLFAESTRAYIHSWIIRLLFRHPMEVQRSADEYLDMLRRHGFQFDRANVSLPYLWWSRWDLGAVEFFGFGVPKDREETLVNVAARKP